ncbi:MAG: hypothetical protein JHC84_15460 [Solirubrobacteraceae bacterium]|nr:hypothetical protein [Solirubrobacteraceae bacterium]
MAVDLSLDEARSSLAYWEHRAERLPRRAVRARREAREMEARWRARITEAERDAYGAGILGLLLFLVLEGRLPEHARHTTRRAARITVRATIATVLVVTTLVVACFVLVVALLASAVL